MSAFQLSFLNYFLIDKTIACVLLSAIAESSVVDPIFDLYALANIQ